MDNNIFKLFDTLIHTHGYKKISNEFNVALGTVKRWKELNSIPKQYHFDLMKMGNIDIDYSLYSYSDKDQFFTTEDTAKYCYKKYIEIINQYDENPSEYTYIEPSAGSGNFLKILPKNTIAFDIEPRHNKVVKQDYLLWKPNDKQRYCVFGNPPFGLRGQLALKFINHSYSFADYVCFILPQLFASDGKGVPRKRVKGYYLIHSEPLKTYFQDPDNKKIKINCIFQIWSKHHINENYIIKNNNNEDITIYSLSDGGTSSTTRNKEMFYKCDAYLPSTCFGEHNMKYYESFDLLPGRKGYGIVFHVNKKEYLIKFKSINWGKVAFLSTNSAYNIRSSQIDDALK